MNGLILITCALLTSVVLWVGPAFAQEAEQVDLDPLPDSVPVGQPVAIGFTFRGSAIPLEEGPKPQVIATNTGSGEIVFLEVEKGRSMAALWPVSSFLQKDSGIWRFAPLPWGGLRRAS